MKNKICGIYVIKNTVNDLCYVGQSIDILTRWVAHKNAAKNKKAAQLENNKALLDNAKAYGVRYETRLEALEGMKEYNRINNEGNEGYIPYEMFISQEEVNAAKL